MKKILSGGIFTILLLIIAIIISKTYSLNEMNVALILGIIAGNLIPNRYKHKFYPGFDCANKKILPAAIIVLGAKLNYLILLSLGVKTIFFVILMVTMLLLTGQYIGKLMMGKEEFGLMLGSGGVASIAASGDVLDQLEEEFVLVLIAMNILGLTGMLIIPVIIEFFKFSNLESAIYIGGVLSSFIHIIPTAYSVGGEKGLALALLIKTGKLLIFPLVLIYMIKFKEKKNKVREDKNKKCQEKKVKQTKLPLFVKGFMLVGLIFTLLTFGIEKIGNPDYLHLLNNIKIICSKVFKYLMMYALVGIGCKINLKTLFESGKKIIYFAIVLMSIQLVLGGVLVKLFY